MKKKEILEVMLVLRKRLNGKCSADKHTCPALIKAEPSFNSTFIYWKCADCHRIYHKIGGGSFYKHIPTCPCTSELPTEIVLTRLDEYIEELGESVENSNI